MAVQQIRICGARKHNLKGVDVSIPRGKMTVITGVSGSGKSSLALDTIFAEARRRYIETLSSTASHFLKRTEPPEVELIEGLCPAVAIDQRTVLRHPRATVGTISEVYDLLRVIFARLGKPHCPTCSSPISSIKLQEARSWAAAHLGKRALVFAPVRCKADFEPMIQELLKSGFIRARIGGRLWELEAIEDRLEPGELIEVVVDRLEVNEAALSRLMDSLEVALKLTGGVATVEVEAADSVIVAETPRCLKCNMELPSAEPAIFSFNDPKGACPHCKGLGFRGLGEKMANRIWAETQEKEPCPFCNGSRLGPWVRCYRVNGVSLDELIDLPISEVRNFLDGLVSELAKQAALLAVVKEAREKVRALCSLSLGYLTLGRSSETLSSGEIQRLKLATKVGLPLVGIMYVLDEPSIGLHPSDQVHLVDVLTNLRDSGNTVIIVEHELSLIMASDWVVDMGPKAGAEGGEIIYCGPPEGLAKSERSLTGAYVAKRRTVPLPHARRPYEGPAIRILGARKNNLKAIDVRFPLGCLTCVTGVSGAGKSTLVFDILYVAARWRLGLSPVTPRGVEKVLGLEAIDSVVKVDQSPIGRTPRSNPATFMGLFAHIRELFARLPEARIRGYGPERFSFNVKGGRCEECAGEGIKPVEMVFLEDVYMVCEACGGKRYNQSTLEVHYKGLDIAQVLELTVKDALSLFSNLPRIAAMLNILNEVGLGYIKLGQPAPTLSGGEAQRLRLARELCRPQRGKALYVMDEPTTGLHLEDVRILIGVLQRLVDAGNTVVVIEHNLDFIKCADYVVDLGPGAGDLGGYVIGTGTPEDLALNPNSVTGRFLKDVLEGLESMA